MHCTLTHTWIHDVSFADCIADSGGTVGPGIVQKFTSTQCKEALLIEVMTEMTIVCEATCRSYMVIQKLKMLQPETPFCVYTKRPFCGLAGMSKFYDYGHPS